MVQHFQVLSWHRKQESVVVVAVSQRWPREERPFDCSSRLSHSQPSSVEFFPQQPPELPI